ncbi:STAS domain-containing protein [Cohnella mopanensis]|uniref:STAS domain-containing protein n=1 Tax=Cohnella mopanensis TaxID=2911966 RepID=UPI001EF76333|nr:STAS domain-containing protein [Cohnella mopanensis]
MCYEIRSIEERIEIVLTGSIGVKEATSIRQQLFPLIQQKLDSVTFHLDAVPDMDSSGLGLLLAVQKICTDFHTTVSFTGMHERLKERLEMAGILF